MSETIEEMIKHNEKAINEYAEFGLNHPESFSRDEVNKFRSLSLRKLFDFKRFLVNGGRAELNPVTNQYEPVKETPKDKTDENHDSGNEAEDGTASEKTEGSGEIFSLPENENTNEEKEEKKENKKNMLKQEFEERVNKTVSDDEYGLIEKVYENHPVMTEKEDIVSLYKVGGIALVKEILPTAEKMFEIKERIRHLKANLQSVENEYAEAKREYFGE